MTPPADTNHTQMIGIIAAIEDELMPTVRRLGLVRAEAAGGTGGRWWRGKVGTHDLVAGMCGVGGERATATLEALNGEFHPRALYNIGFVGALTPHHAAGDVLTFGSVMRLTSGKMQSRSPRIDTATDIFTQAASPSDAPTLLSSDTLVHDPAQKRQLAIATGAVAVDMESFALAETCGRLGIRLCIVRGISDPVGMALPEALPGWVKPDGRRNALRAAGYLATHPWHVPAVIKLAGNSSRAAKAIAEHLAGDLARR